MSQIEYLEVLRHPVTDRARRTRTRKEWAALWRDKGQWYKWLHLGIWAVITYLTVLDRFYWNLWPRQTIGGFCQHKCGGDFIAGPGEDILKPGPWGAKAFDALARVSARVIITTTSLMFITMSHCTWNRLSEVEAFKPYLYNWRNDNLWIHTVGGWTIVATTLAHVWSLFLPSIFNGYGNIIVGGSISWPLQVARPGPQINIETEEAVWGVDDVWRIFWMTVVLGFLLPYSRSGHALGKSYSLAMWLHLGGAAGFFLDSFRRRTHPHVWIVNFPFVLWYTADRIAAFTWYRADRGVPARRILLDDNYMLLLWRQSRTSQRICDVYWIKQMLGSKDRRTGEWGHPFTTCSAHTVRLGDKSLHTMIELPFSTDVTWGGHRYRLHPGGATAGAGTGAGPNRAIAPVPLPPMSPVKRLANIVSEVDGHISPSTPVLGVEAMWGRGDDDESFFSIHVKQPYGERGSRQDTDVDSEIDLMDEASDPGAEMEAQIVRLSNAAFERYRAEVRAGTVTLTEEEREEEQQEQGWDTMAIARIQRRPSPEAFRWSCLGTTCAVDCFRYPETARMADCEAELTALRGESRPFFGGGKPRIDVDDGDGDDDPAARVERVPLMTFGPYRSEYGRLLDLPNLPPVLVVGTGAGAGLVLDVMAHIRKHRPELNNSVSIFYSAASLALVQFVTDNLLAEQVPNVTVRTTLTRHEHLRYYEGEEVTPRHRGSFKLGRFDMEAVLETVGDDTEVYFCGAGGINRVLREECAARGMKYVGSSVQ